MIAAAHWREATLRDVCDITHGLTFQPNELVPQGTQGAVACLRTKNVQRELDLDDLIYLPARFGEETGMLLREGDTLISTANSAEQVGKCCLVPRLPFAATFGGFVAMVRSRRPVVDPNYLYFWLSSEPVQARLRSMARQTTNIANLPPSEIQRVGIPVPPLSEQRRVVNILQEAESVWRLHTDADRRAAEIIPAIFHEMFNQFLSGAAPAPRRPLKEFADVQGGLQVTTRRDSLPLKAPYLRVANVYRDFLELTKMKAIGLTESEFARVRLRVGDILLVEGHGNPNEVGRAAIWDGSIPNCVHQNHLIRVRCAEGLDPVYACAVINSGFGKQYFHDAGNTTSGLNTITTGVVGRMAIAIPPLELQRRFRQRVEHTRSVTDGLAKANSAEVELLQSLLFYAFAGELTAAWRQRHAKQLAEEARQRDNVLKRAGVTPQKISAKESEAVFETPTDGQWSELSREQRELWRFIPQQPFTAGSLADDVGGELHDRPDAIRRHLEVFCARGLLVSVTRQRLGDDQKAEFAHVYRKPYDDERQWLNAEVSRLVQSFAPGKKA
jgi:type I restriction enzyme S subunit